MCVHYGYYGCGAHPQKSTENIAFQLPEPQQARPVEVPSALGQLVAVNIEYRVLLCVSPKCCKAASPAGLVEHLCKIHEAEPQVRRH